jgi:hypothetical protein
MTDIPPKVTCLLYGLVTGLVFLWDERADEEYSCDTSYAIHASGLCTPCILVSLSDEYPNRISLNSMLSGQNAEVAETAKNMFSMVVDLRKTHIPT